IRRARAGNVISENAPLTVGTGTDATTIGFGILITDAGTNVNLVTGNFIGTDRSGTQGLGNQLDGVKVTAGATGNQIGQAGKPNVISGNVHAGIEAAGTSVFIRGNLIGTDVTGTVPLGDGLFVSPGDKVGILVDQGAEDIEIGDGIRGGNIISGNE